MSDEIIVTPNDVITDQSIKRLIAEALRRRGTDEMYASSTGKKASFANYLALMLWDIIVDGRFLFADGTKVQIEDYGEWLATVKFVSSHIDGPVGNEVNVGQVNIFKVYKNIDSDLV